MQVVCCLEPSLYFVLAFVSHLQAFYVLSTKGSLYCSRSDT